VINAGSLLWAAGNFEGRQTIARHNADWRDEKVAIQFASTAQLRARPDKHVCRENNSPARSSRMHVCSNRKSRTIVRRGPSHGQVDLDNPIVSMMPLVKRVALQFRGHLPPHVELDDLVSAGVLGLIDAVRKFDPTKGVTIESYARFRIRGAILDSLRDVDPASRDMRRKIKKIELACQNLEFQLGRPASDAEMAHAMGLSLEKWYEMGTELQRLGFEGVGEKNFQEIKQRVDEENIAAGPADDPFELCYRREQCDILGRALQCLTERERSIMTLYYQDALTMKQIGARLGIDESRVSQLHSAALTRLRARVSAMVQGVARSTAASLRPCATIPAQV
jgi:RNA polymerase sigma factor for flagellar operon FliA